MKKTKIVTISLATISLLLFIFRYQLSDIITDIVAEYFMSKSNINKEYILSDDYVVCVYGTTSPIYYELVTDENIDSVFEKSKLLNYINTIEDLEKLLNETGIVEITTAKNKKERFKNYGFSVETEDSFINCDVIKTGNGKYYINMCGRKYTNIEKIYVEYYIETMK